MLDAISGGARVRQGRKASTVPKIVSAIFHF